MAIPVHLQQFKAAGIYRVVYDKSTVLTEDSQILRLVVGYSEQGPFNTPVLVRNPQDFVALFGGISKKLEKRGVFFHRLALQMLQTAPILALNLKKFDGETVQGATISTDFNPNYQIIDTVNIKVEDIYDTTRFWRLDNEQLNDLSTAEGAKMDQYINICVTGTKNVTYFIRKASGSKVNGYNITVNDWYSNEDMPEFMEKYKNNLISDFFAEIYVFKGKFSAKQVLASSTLKNYFVITKDEDEDGNKILKLRDKVINAFGDAQDTLDALYFDDTSNAIGRWVGCLIPQFVNKQGSYESLDILFNVDSDLHGMMMSFNTNMLYEEDSANIDLSGRLSIPVEQNDEVLNKLYQGIYTTSVLGNLNAPVVTDKISFVTNVYTPARVIYTNEDYKNEDGTYNKDDNGNYVPTKEGTPLPAEVLNDFYDNGKNRISGTLYVTEVDKEHIKLHQVDSHIDVVIKFNNKEGIDVAASKFNIIFKDNNGDVYNNDTITKGLSEGKVFGDIIPKDVTPIPSGVYFEGNDAFMRSGNPLEGPTVVITGISRLENVGPNDEYEENTYWDKNTDIRVSFFTVEARSITEYTKTEYNLSGSVYGSSLSFITINGEQNNNNAWHYDENFQLSNNLTYPALVCKDEYDKSLLNILRKGDMLLADDGAAIDSNNDGTTKTTYDDKYDIVFVQESGTKYKADGTFECYYIIVSGEPKEFNSRRPLEVFFVRVDSALNQEIGTIVPQYIEGYVYKNDKPLGTGMRAKLEWQNSLLSALTDYKGLRTGLLNKGDIDYRYVVDTFESYPDNGLKSILTYLCKEKQSAFAIINFPSVTTFVKCPYASYTDSNGVFNVQYIVDGCNKKKSSALSFSLPNDFDGASFGAYYTPLKFTDGYIDTIVPSAGLVSNLFVEKYQSRQPYYIVAGPNYGSINAAGLIGPDYKYSMDELQVIEPYGVNVMVYRPSFGTFINANQTAKQTPKSALSSINVRELVIYLQDEIERVLQQYQWEFNNARTRNAILDRANQICALVAANGGIQAYLNVMDESNNTPDIIDNEMAVLSTHIEPGRGCGKMVHELTLYRTGKLSAQSIES